jgi:hypothetical protein
MHFKAVFDLVTYPGVASWPTFLGAMIGAIVGAVPYLNCMMQCAADSSCQSDCLFPLHYVFYFIVAGLVCNAALQIFNKLS